MELGISLILAVATTAATLAAFGGDTWVDGPGSLWRRITVRGWVSLAFLVISFGLGIAKEVAASTGAAKLAVARDQAFQDAKSANERLVKVEAKLDTTAAALQDSAKLVTSLNTDIASIQKERDYLVEQATNLQKQWTSLPTAVLGLLPTEFRTPVENLFSAASDATGKSPPGGPK